MKTTPIYLLATCRKTELLPAATLVFKTLRTGFPENPVTVWINTDDSKAVAELERNAYNVGADTRPIRTIHHQWIEMLVMEEDQPFWLCDTDVVFLKRCDKWNMEDVHLSGCLTPRFYDRFTRCVTEPRLHTSLLYIDPVRVRRLVHEWRSQVHITQFSPPANLYYPLLLPRNSFYDTCSLLYQAIGGTAFNPEQLACYEHLHCATWVDMAELAYPGMSQVHQAVYKNPSLAKGLRSIQDTFYAANSV